MFYYQSCNDRLGPQQMNYQFSISLKNQYIFCEVAKSGCSAVKRALWRQEVKDVPMPRGFSDTYNNPHVAFPHHLLVKPFQLGEAGFNQAVRDPSFVKWTVVRNPFTRALSGYLDKVCRNEPQFANIRNRVAKMRGNAPEDIEHTDVSFEQFCEALATFEKPIEFDPHWRPQFLHTCGDILPYTHIAKLESLDESLEHLTKLVGFKNLNFSSGRPHATNANEKLPDFYTDRCIEIIRDVYALDFLHFGYDRDLPR